MWILLLAVVPVTYGQEVSAGEKRFEIRRTVTIPDIDGKVGADEWRAATQVDDLHEVFPNEFSSPSEETLWYLSYDNKALYVAALAFDPDPNAIVAHTLRQGASLDSDDSLRILIDAFNNKRSGYTFALNPNGVRYDAIYTNGTRENDDWEGIWRGAAKLTDEGWSMEMAIPFNTLNFNPDNSTWGINLWRRITRRDETIAWSSRNGRVNPTVSGEVSGLYDLSQGKGLDLIPSISSTYSKDRVARRSNSDISPSLDINYKLGNSVNVLITIDTDFAATEVDSRQLDLQRFSLFFPEKRSFFLTDFDIFQFGGVPTTTGRAAETVGVRSGNNGLAFFSRRIGLSVNQEPVDIDFGAKVSGRLGEYDFGTLYIRQDAFASIEKKDMVVGRILRRVFEESALGAIFTGGDPSSNDSSSLAGVDFLYRNTRLPNNRSLETQFWLQESNNAGVSGKEIAYSASVSLPAEEGLEAGAQYHVVEENFRPALGFANRVGVRLYAAQLGYWTLIDFPVRLRQIGAELKLQRWEFLDTGRIQTQKIEAEFAKFRSTAGDFMRFDATLSKEGLRPGEQPLEEIGILIPAGEYSFERFGTVLRTAGHRKVSLAFRYEDGDYFNGQLMTVRPEIGWRPNEHLRFALEFDYNKYDFPSATAITRQITLESDFAFNSKLSLTTLLQYDNVSDDVGMNARLRFNLQAGRDIWLVLNHNMIEDPLENRFRSTETAAALKVRYTFRY